MRETYELRVGFFMLGALILLVGGWGWLKGISLVNPPQLFWVRFHDVAGLSNNATINVQGVRVGNVDQVAFKLPEGLKDAPETKTQKTEPRVYVRMKLNNIHVPQNAEITIQTLGMVGAKYVEITLPPEEPGVAPQPLDPNVVVEGKDPVRVELVINNLAKKLNRVADTISSDEASETFKHLSSASRKLDRNLDSMPELTSSMKKASASIETTAKKFGHTADRTEMVADRARSFFDQGRTSFATVNTLAADLDQTNKKVSKILDNPAFGKDLKETVDTAHKTALSAQAAISQLSSTMEDKDLRKDMLTMLQRIQTSSQDISHSMQIVNKLADDRGLRSDIRGSMQDARDAMTKANQIFQEPAFRADLSQTMCKVRSAASDVDVAAKQIHRILGKRAPLLQMLFAHPGKQASGKQEEKQEDGTSVNANGGITN